jgi:hypothetical protein
MPKLRVLISITSEAVVDVPDDAQDVDAYLRERVSLAWGEAQVQRLVHEDISVAFYPVEESVEEPPAALEETFVEADDAPAVTTDEVDRVVALAEASIVEIAPEAVDEAPAESVVAEPAEVVEEPVDEAIEPASAVEELVQTEAVEAEAVEPVHLVDEVVPSPLVPVASGTHDHAPRDLTDDEVLSLFTDPLYHDMIRSAVRDRAVAMLETVVAEVVSELEPLIRRQAERKRPTGA